jgi:hypothetical protein
MPYTEFCVFDAETIAPLDVDQWVEPGEAPSNYKDPDKIKAYVAEDKRKRCEKAATDIDLAEVICCGYAWSDGDRLVGGVWDKDTREIELVRGALEYMAETPLLLGFRIQFDVPLVLRRAQLLGLAIDLPRFEFSKYRPSELVWPHGHRTQVIDIGAVLTFYGTIPGKSLDWYARRFGCPIADIFDGSEVGALWQAQKYDAIEAHCRADIERTAWLAQRLGVIAGQPVAA